MLGPLLERRRLVLVDMRGTGHSRAIDCPALEGGHGTPQFGVAQCARILGPTYGSYRTSAAADDLDAVRERLGLERITMYGDSYGTFLAQSYAYRHREHLEALILDSAYPVRGESALVSEPVAKRDPLVVRHLPPCRSVSTRRSRQARAFCRAPASDAARSGTAARRDLVRREPAAAPLP